MQTNHKISRLFFITITSVIIVLFSNQIWSQIAKDDNNISLGLNSITKSDISSHMEFLVNKCSGRGNGQEGLQIAARYIADQFKRFDLGLINDSTAYFQHFNWLKYETFDNVQSNFQIIDEKGDSIHFKGIKIDYEPSIFSANGHVAGELIFVGYGISKIGYDDYKDLDVMDKIVCIMRHEPHHPDHSFKNSWKMSDHAKLITKILNARQHGAKGVIIFTDPFSYENYYKNHRYKNYVYEFGQPAFWSFDYDKITIPVIYIYYHTAQIIFKNYDIGKIQKEIDDSYTPHSFAISGIKAFLEVNIKRHSSKIQNVFGIIEGSDPKIKNELVVAGAHYDHEGIRGKRVYPGADDNASGTTAILEIAESFRKMNKHPRRTVVFIAFGAEEPKGGMDGTVGSEYYLETLCPSKQIYCMINFDMIGRNRDFEVSLTGWFKNLLYRENSNEIFITGPAYCQKIRTLADTLNKSIGLELNYSNAYGDSPVMHLGDHYNFFSRRIPIISFYDAMNSDLHGPGDTIDKIDFDKMEKVTKLGYLIAWQIANLDEQLEINNQVWFKQYKEFLSWNKWF